MAVSNILFDSMCSLCQTISLTLCEAAFFYTEKTRPAAGSSPYSLRDPAPDSCKILASFQMFLRIYPVMITFPPFCYLYLELFVSILRMFFTPPAVWFSCLYHIGNIVIYSVIIWTIMMRA